MAQFIWIALAILGIPGGMIAGYFFRKSWAVREAKTAESRAEALLQEARSKEKTLLLEAKDKAIKIIDDAKREETTRRAELQHLQSRLERREALFDQKLLELEQKQGETQQRANRLENLKQQVKDIQTQQLERLAKIAELNRDQARDLLLEKTESQMKDELLQRIRKLQRFSNEEIDREARTLLSTIIQRVASSHVAETTTTVVSLPNDEMKGRIIGREGRNIKTIESLTGVEIVVDETPGAIVISGFNPIRRHIAKRTLERLIQDGRIHPARIEDTIETVKKELAADIRKAGEEAAYEAGVAGLDPKLVQILGRLKYRTSYGQNQLIHAIEVSLLSRLLAEEIGANVAVAKKGGLLHDIGKAMDHEVQGGHPQIGYEIMKKFGLPEEVAYIAIAHHEDAPKTLEGVIAKVADAISGSRPGARKDSYENYVQRLEELENVAKSFEGVEKCYAIQAGREVRVFVRPKQVDDYQATMLAKGIAGKIEQELKYPGEIKVNVIRETRVVEYAR